MSRKHAKGPGRGAAGARAAKFTADLALGRDLYRRGAWADAYRSLAKADQAAKLGGDDLFLLAMCAGLLGRDEDTLKGLERAHQAYVEAGELPKAARAAFWLLFRLFSLGESGRAGGWLARANRLLERDGRDCAERGYLLVPVVRRHFAEGDDEAAFEAAAEAAAIGDRFGDADLVAFARNLQGRALLRRGRVREGLAFLDEAMVAVTAGEVSPVLTGIIYCNVIQSCHQVYALSRCREWTEALAAWCAQQPEVIFTGLCLVHRSEILQFHGEWRGAMEEAERAVARLSEKRDPREAAAAFYQEAEVHRLRGEFDEAESDSRRSSRLGGEPQPGLSLLRLAQGQAETAASQIRRVVLATTERLQRTRLLPACVEILLAAGDVAEAEQACRELEENATYFDTDVLHAMAAHARGAILLARGDAKSAIVPLRRSLETWQRVGAPYIGARLRVLIARACRTLGDEEGAGLELDAARAVFRELGAAPDLAGLDASAPSALPERPRGLTARELQVLRLVASGKTNKTIAAELFLSEKTVDRHLSNIFAKLDVPSRAAATAFAYEHKIV